MHASIVIIVADDHRTFPTHVERTRTVVTNRIYPGPGPGGLFGSIFFLLLL
jgi:hypothetical protein